MVKTRKPLSDEAKKKIGLANRGIWIDYVCENCNKDCSEKKSHFDRKKRHYCSMACYSAHRKTWNFTEMQSYKGVRKEGETRQVYHRNYCKSNPINISHLKARRYAREKGAKGTHTLQQWKDLKDTYGNTCASCGLLLKLTKDHIIPLSKGGSDYIENIQPLCKSCNSRKSNKTIHQHPELLTTK